MHTQNPFKETEDRLQFARALDKARASKSRAAFTDFLNPQRCAVFLQQFIKACTEVEAWGGYPDAERKMLGFGVDHAEDKFPIVPLDITYNTRFSKQLTHRDFLGAVLGLGLDRGKIGDIRLGADGAVMYVASEVADFIAESLREVGRTSVTVSLNRDVEVVEAAGTQKRISVASLRLDAVISTALNLSRGKAAALIDSERVFVNWVEGKKTRELKEGDIVTVRQVGRLQVDSILGATKKERVAVLVTVF